MIWLLALQLAVGAAQLPGPEQYAISPEQHYANAKQDFTLLILINVVFVVVLLIALLKSKRHR